MARKTPKINVLLSINKTTFFKTSETNLKENYGTRKHDYWRDSSYFELKNSSLEGFSEKKRSFLDFEHFGKQHDRTFPLLSSPTFPLLSGSFNAFFLLDIKFGWRGAQVVFLFSIFEAEVTIRRKRRRWARKFPRFRPVDPPTNDTHDGTELKKLIPAWGA